MSLNNLSDNARIWVYIFKQELSDNEAAQVKNSFDQFVASWQCHGSELTGAYELIEKRIIILGVDENQNVSGCSIDSSVRVLKALREDIGVDALDQTLIHYRDENNDIHSASRIDFATLCKNGDILTDSLVFDPMISKLADYRQGKLEKPFAESWHAQAFQLAECL